jgi:hypothetical protein
MLPNLARAVVGQISMQSMVLLRTQRLTQFARAAQRLISQIFDCSLSRRRRSRKCSPQGRRPAYGPDVIAGLQLVVITPLLRFGRCNCAFIVRSRQPRFRIACASGRTRLWQPTRAPADFTVDLCDSVRDRALHHTRPALPSDSFVPPFVTVASHRLRRGRRRPTLGSGKVASPARQTAGSPCATDGGRVCFKEVRTAQRPCRPP